MRHGLQFCCLLLVAAGVGAAEPEAPRPRNPVAAFRNLLLLQPDARTRELAAKPGHLREIISTRLREYDALSPAEREARLRATELRFHLKPLLTLAPTAREPQLATIPESFRPLVTERLAAWDKLPTEIRREILANEPLLQAMTRPAVAGAFPPLPPGLVPTVPDNVTHWQSLDARQREQLLDNFNHYFRLDDRSKSQVVAALPEPKRAEATRTLNQFEQLSTGERATCLAALKKLGQMTPEQQARFFANAEQWQKLPESERAVWRKVVVDFPPLPPGAGAQPPLPPGTHEAKH